MNIAVIGMWHLGCVTAACLSSVGHDVIAFDDQADLINKLNDCDLPIFEPGLKELTSEALAANKLRFTSQRRDVSTADVVWVTIDTPVDDRDMPDVQYVIEKIKALIAYLKVNAVLLISSQIPVGSTALLQRYCDENHPDKNIQCCYSPENLRLGNSINIFLRPDRVVMGVESERGKNSLSELMKPISHHIIWMGVAAAEMTKHAINAFLATSVVFINELAVMCERLGIDATQVERGLKSESRIGEKAYLKPGSAIAGGTLARDVNYLVDIASNIHVPVPLFDSLLKSNTIHKNWAVNHIKLKFSRMEDISVAILGLTYKPNTDTLRRSTVIEIAKDLNSMGAKIIAYDPMIKALPAELKDTIKLVDTADEALHAADVLVLGTEWKEFRELTTDQVVRAMKTPTILDAGGFLLKTLGSDARISYCTVGVSR